MKFPSFTARTGVCARLICTRDVRGPHRVLAAVSLLAAVLFCGLALIPPAARAQTKAQTKPQTKRAHTVLDGIYTPSQAARGEVAYSKTCAECHDLSFDGTPVEGSGFIDNWREFPLDVLYTFIVTTMPEDTPGELSEDSYRDVLAYILKRNGYPEGKSDLTLDAIKSTQMVGLDGPKPLVSEMLVQATGCFLPGPDNTWELTQSSDPVRIRKADPTTPAEVQEAAATPAGTQKFKLVNLEYFQTDPAGQNTFSPDSYKAQKVLAKGALVKDSYGARINVMAVEKLGASCGK